MIIIPERYSYCEIYLTLRCQFACPYCINQHTGVSRSRKELTAREWCIALNNIESHIPLTFGGGEPTMHKEFYEIVERLRPEHKIDLLTNGEWFEIEEFTDRIMSNRFTNKGNDYKAIRISYHPKKTNRNKVVERAAILQNMGYPVGIFGLNHPDNLKANIEMTELCRQRGVFFFIRDFLGYYNDLLFGYYKYPAALNGNKKQCECRSEELLVGPDGNCYRCHRDLYAGTGEIGNLLNMAFEIKDEFRPCDNFGSCNPCDVKEKIKSDLTTSKCAVEIKE
jgi:MoaA/NifB/PqqE/SkfB family radical SAM enzyme